MSHHDQLVIRSSSPLSSCPPSPSPNALRHVRSRLSRSRSPARELLVRPSRSRSPPPPSSLPVPSSLNNRFIVSTNFAEELQDDAWEEDDYEQWLEHMEENDSFLGTESDGNDDEETRPQQPVNLETRGRKCLSRDQRLMIRAVHEYAQAKRPGTFKDIADWFDVTIDQVRTAVHSEQATPKRNPEGPRK